MTLPHDIKARHDEAVLEGVAAQARGRFGLALDLFEESLALAESLGERRKIHAARLNVSGCYLSLGDWAAARSGLASIILESDDPRHISAAAIRLAEALVREGRLEKAGNYLRMALEQSRQTGDGHRVVIALMLQGRVAGLDGRHEEAVQHFTEALALRRELGDEGGHDIGSMLDNLGYAQLLTGRIATGLWTLKRSLRIHERRENAWGRAEAHVDLAFGFLLGDRNAAAERHALRALALAIENGYAPIRKNGTYVLMEVALRQDRAGDFERWFRELQELMPDVKLSRDFFKIFDISDVINLKEF